MVRRLCICAILAAAIVIISGVQARSTTEWRPTGTLIQRSDLSHAYIAGEGDDGGQWQVAWGNPENWVMLVRVNPQLSNPNLFMPGDTLNVPPELVADFVSVVGPAQQTAPEPIYKPDTASVVPATTPTHSGTPWWLLVLALAVLAAVALIAYYYGMRARIQLAHERSQRRQAEQERERQRVLADPYSGPPVRENGLPTVEAAEAFFAETYRSQREGLTVAQNAQLPSQVAIDRIRAVDVRGPMMVTYRYGHPERRNVEVWTPAWQCFFSDGTFRITLMRCANDVRGGGGMQALPETQIRPRQDIPEREVHRQVWPPVPVGTVPPEAAPVVPETVEAYTSVKVTSPTRYVLHRESGPETIIDLGVLANLVTLGLEGGEIYAIVGGQRRVIGRIVNAQESPETPSASEPTVTT